MRAFFLRHKLVFLFGLSLGLLLVLLRWMELRWLVFMHSTEIYIGGIALIFTLMGGWLALRLTNPKTVVVEKEVVVSEKAVFERNTKTLKELGLSSRELEVLELMALGCSNQEIADRLFVSLNTIKTHSSRIFEKLEVSRRTQAVEKARKLSIIA